MTCLSQDINRRQYCRVAPDCDLLDPLLAELQRRGNTNINRVLLTLKVFPPKVRCPKPVQVEFMPSDSLRQLRGLARTESSSMRTTLWTAVEMEISATGIDSSTGKQVSTVSSRNSGHSLELLRVLQLLGLKQQLGRQRKCKMIQVHHQQDKFYATVLQLSWWRFLKVQYGKRGKKFYMLRICTRWA